jgi:hypothetical protein
MTIKLYKIFLKINHQSFISQGYKYQYVSQIRI